MPLPQADTLSQTRALTDDTRNMATITATLSNLTGLERHSIGQSLTAPTMPHAPTLSQSIALSQQHTSARP